MKCRDFSEIITQWNRDWSTRPAVRMLTDAGSETVSFGELYDLVMQRAEELRNEEFLCAGMLGAPSLSWIVDFFASALAGKRTVLLDPTLSDEVLQAFISEYEIQRILPDDKNYVMAETTDPSCPGHVLLFTSGTAASNKAVVLSQKALAYSAWNGQSMLACGEGDVIVTMLPLNHVFGLVCTCLWPLSFGACIAIGRGMRYYTIDPKEYGATILVSVPTLLNYLVKADCIPESVHTVLAGAAPCSASVLQAITAKGIRVSHGYGLSETASGLAISVGAKDPLAMDLCPDTKITISEEGEVLVSTPCMMEEYWKRPQETASVLHDGVLSTGDLGFLDENGRLHISGRKNDVLVLSSGEKIFCPEWEAELSKLIGEEIALCAPGGKLTLCAPEGTTDSEVRKAVDAFNLKQPISRRILDVRVIDGKLPRTATGKIRRWKLEELL